MAKRFTAWGVVAWAVFGAAGTAHAGHDVDGDGRDDVVWRNTATGADGIWSGANATAPHPMARVADTAWTIAGEGDFDGDGRADVFWRNLATGANVIWRTGDATRAIATAAVTDLRWQVAGVGDFDGDGRDDVLWRHSAAGVNGIWLSGNAATRRVVAPVSNLRWIVAGTGDFDGDGGADIFWRNLDTGTNVVWRSANVATQQLVARVADAAWQVGAICDFDGDGRDDVFWRHLGSGRNAIWRHADAASLILLPAVTNRAWQVAAAGDFDGDGHADLLWRDFVIGANVVWRGADPTVPMAETGVGNLDWAVMPFEAQPTRPLLSIAPLVTVAEGDSGSRAVPFAIRLSHPSALPVTYRYSIHTNALGAPNGAIDATPGSDFVEADAYRTIAPMRPADGVDAIVFGDVTPEPHEAFNVVPYEANGAILLWIDGVGVIDNDDGLTVWITSASVVESDSGFMPMTFMVWLSAPSNGAVRVTAATVSGPGGVFVATPGLDYVATQQELAFPANATSVPFTVQVIGDTIGEPLVESFAVSLANAQGGAVLVHSQAAGLIIDDEPTSIP